MKRHYTPHFSISPEFEKELDERLAGYHCRLRNVSYNPNESANWREGWERADRGDSLTTRELRYIMR